MAGELAAVDRRLGEGAVEQRGVVGLAEGATQRRARVADVAHQAAGVDVLDRDDAVVGEPPGEVRPRAAHDDGLALDGVGLEAALVDAVVADQRVAEHQHLGDV